MAKLLLLSVLLSVVIIPMIAARDEDPKRGLKRAVLGMAGFNTAYVLALFYVWTRIAS